MCRHVFLARMRVDAKIMTWAVTGRFVGPCWCVARQGQCSSREERSARLLCGGSTINKSPVRQTLVDAEEGCYVGVN